VREGTGLDAGGAEEHLAAGMLKRSERVGEVADRLLPGAELTERDEAEG
jgi:hypothetical protein